MTSQDYDRGIKEGIARENRLVNMERDIEAIKDTLHSELPKLVQGQTDLVDIIHKQNGRVTRLENRQVEYEQNQEDFTQLRFVPLVAEVQSIGDQLKVIYHERAKETGVLEDKKDRAERMEKWIDRLRSRITLTTALLALIGYDEMLELIRNIFGIFTGDM